jgi:hypothetical protein
VSDFRSLEWLAVLVLVCFIVAVASLHFMRVAANRRLPDSDKFSYLLPFSPPFNRWNRVTDAYKRLYPRGRAYPIWQVSAIGTAVLAIGIVLAEIWELAVSK